MTLVLVDPCRWRLRRAWRPISVADPILAQCRLALTYARWAGVPVIFVRDRRGSGGWQGPAPGPAWIEGFEPRRHESVFERAGRSCYESPYFREVVEGAGGVFAVAGFIGPGGCGATAADARAAGHIVLFLVDAIDDDRLETPSLHLVALRDWLGDRAGRKRPW